jgi:hypothetical protein
MEKTRVSLSIGLSKELKDKAGNLPQPELVFPVSTPESF